MTISVCCEQLLIRGKAICKSIDMNSNKWVEVVRKWKLPLENRLYHPVYQDVTIIQVREKSG